MFSKSKIPPPKLFAGFKSCHRVIPRTSLKSLLLFLLGKTYLNIICLSFYEDEFEMLERLMLIMLPVTGVGGRASGKKAK